MATDAITRQQATKISEEIRQAVAKILTDHGLTEPKVKTTYGDVFKISLTSSPIQEGPNGVNLASPEALAYLADAKYSPNLYNPDALGKEFVAGGETYIFAGRLVRARAYLWLAIRKRDGAHLKFRDHPAIEAILRTTPITTPDDDDLDDLLGLNNGEV